MSPAAAAVTSSFPAARPLEQRCTRAYGSAGAAVGINGAFSDMIDDDSTILGCRKDGTSQLSTKVDDGWNDGRREPGADDDAERREIRGAWLVGRGTCIGLCTAKEV
jgi:hypothetical protein